MIASIDNGLTGGIVILSPLGQIIAKRVMPTRKRDKNEVDIGTFRDWLVGATGDNLLACHFVIEEPCGSKSLNAAKSMASSFHAIRGALDWKGLSWEPIRARTWQKHFGIEKNNTKESAFELAKSIWPDEDWLRSERCVNPHDGMVDAALIGKYILETRKL